MTKRNYNFILLGTLALLMFAAFYRRLLVDDAFISFRYARNLVDGLGLTWNAGEYLEGYSNFLWVLIVAAGMKLGFEPEGFTYLLSIPLHLTGLVATYYLARQVFASALSSDPSDIKTLADRPPDKINSIDLYSLLVLIWVGTNKSLFCFATAGMETTLQFALYSVIALLAVRSFAADWNVKSIVAVSVLMNLAFLSRLDSVTIILPVMLIFFHRIFNMRNYFTGEPYQKALTTKSRIRYVILMTAFYS